MFGGGNRGWLTSILSFFLQLPCSGSVVLDVALDTFVVKVAVDGITSSLLVAVALLDTESPTYIYIYIYIYMHFRRRCKRRFYSRSASLP
jgi:hypothetical protein